MLSGILVIGILGNCKTKHANNNIGCKSFEPFLPSYFMCVLFFKDSKLSEMTKSDPNFEGQIKTDKKVEQKQKLK